MSYTIHIDGNYFGTANAIKYTHNLSAINTSVTVDLIGIREDGVYAGPQPLIQVMPVNINIFDNTGAISVRNAWVTNLSVSTDDSYNNLTDISVTAESIEIFDEIKCKYCLMAAKKVYHSYLLQEMTGAKDRINYALELLGIKPFDADINTVYREETLEIIKGHYKEIYNEIERLIILL